MAPKRSFHDKDEIVKRNLLHQRKEHVFFVSRRYYEFGPAFPCLSADPV